MISDTSNGTIDSSITVNHCVVFNGTIEKNLLNAGTKIMTSKIRVEANIAKNNILFFGCSFEKNDKV